MSLGRSAFATMMVALTLGACGDLQQVGSTLGLDRPVGPAVGAAPKTGGQVVSATKPDLTAPPGALGHAADTPRPADAETASAVRGNPLERLLASQKHRAAVQQAALDSFKVFDACASAEARPTGTVRLQRPLSFDEAGNVRSGAVIEEVMVTGCGRAHRANVVTAMRGEEGRPPVFPGIPGDSRADLVLQRDTLRFTRSLAQTPDPDCQWVRVVDTRIDARVAWDASGWGEIWTTDACGTRTDYAIRFAPGGGSDGGTVFTVSVPAQKSTGVAAQAETTDSITSFGREAAPAPALLGAVTPGS